MKTFKKIALGFSLLLALCIFAVSNAQVKAATDWDKFWGSCAQLVVVGFGINCNTEDSNAKFTYATYSSSAQFVTATYQASFVDSPGKTPERITITDSGSKKLIDPTSNALKNSTFIYSSKGTSKSTDDNNKPINYLVYYPLSGSRDYSLIVRDNGNNTYRVLALVNNKVIERGTGDYIYAWEINKIALGSTSTGAPVKVAADISADENEGDACLANSGGWALAWVACPVLSAANSLTTFLVDNFEDQLAFNVSQLGSTTDPNSGSYKIHQTWSLIKNIASALVVIVMLVMVLSQAISVGPFDAYTVRKLLPRLVAVVILMQLSWPLCVYIIDIVNNLGRGIADIMFLPFGGADNMDLWSLLNNANLGNGTLVAMNWGALLVFGVLGVAFLFTMLGLAFMAIIALLFAVVTLIFRKILIVTLIIFVPIALLAWTLPGTERYWKLWRENFLKVLMMFPIIMAIIASGRIFAYVVGTPDTNKFMALLFILVGFFGPLFLLPRTFKWGGQAMNLAGERIMGVGKTVGDRQKNFMKSRQEGWNAERTRRSQERVSRKEGFNSLRPWRLPVDKVKSGQWDPTLWGRRSEEHLNSYIAKGAASEEEEYKQANARLRQTYEQLDETRKGNSKDDLVRAIARGQSDFTYYTVDGQAHKIGKIRESDKRAALDQLSALGGAGNMRVLAETLDELQDTGDPGSQERQDALLMRNKFLNANAGSLFAKMPHLYKGVDSTISGLSAENITQMDGVEMEYLMGNLTNRLNANPHDDVAAQSLAKLTSTYHAAATSEATNRRIPASVSQAMRVVATGKGLAEINADIKEHAPGNPLIVDPTKARAASESVSPAVRDQYATISRIVSEGGIVNSNAPATTTPATIRAQVTNESARTLPNSADLRDSTQRDAYIIQLRTDQRARDNLARGLAYGAFGTGPAAPERAAHLDALEEMKNRALAGSDEDKASFNSLINQVQQAYFQRAQEVVDRHSPQDLSPNDIADRRRVAQATIAPEVTRLDSMRIL